MRLVKVMKHGPALSGGQLVGRIEARVGVPVRPMNLNQQAAGQLEVVDVSAQPELPLVVEAPVIQKPGELRLEPVERPAGPAGDFLNGAGLPVPVPGDGAGNPASQRPPSPGRLLRTRTLRVAQERRSRV